MYVIVRQGCKFVRRIFQVVKPTFTPGDVEILCNCNMGSSRCYLWSVKAFCLFNCNIQGSESNYYSEIT